MPTHFHGREKITPEKGFLLSLWYFGNMETFRQIAARFNVTISSEHYILKKVIKFFLSLNSTLYSGRLDKGPI